MVFVATFLLMLCWASAASPEQATCSTSEPLGSPEETSLLASRANTDMGRRLLAKRLEEGVELELDFCAEFFDGVCPYISGPDFTSKESCNFVKSSKQACKKTFPFATKQQKKTQKECRKLGNAAKKECRKAITAGGRFTREKCDKHLVENGLCAATPLVVLTNQETLLSEISELYENQTFKKYHVVHGHDKDGRKVKVKFSESNGTFLPHLVERRTKVHILLQEENIASSTANVPIFLKDSLRSIECPPDQTVACPQGCGSCMPQGSCSSGSCSAKADTTCTPGCKSSGGASDSCSAVVSCPFGEFSCTGAQAAGTVCSLVHESSGTCKFQKCPLGAQLCSSSSSSSSCLLITANGCTPKTFYETGEIAGDVQGECPLSPSDECNEPKNVGSLGYPDFLRNPLVSPTESRSCVVACACNRGSGSLYVGPPNGCEPISQVASGGSSQTCCMCINDKVLVTSQENGLLLFQNAAERAQAGFSSDHVWNENILDHCGNYRTVLNPYAPSSCPFKILDNGLKISTTND